MTTYKRKLKLLKDGIKPHKCELCNNTEWLSKPIALELHHIDGNSENNNLTNLQMLCPNCHATTPNYRGKNKKSKPKVVVTDDELVSIIKDSYTIRQALIRVKLSCGAPNYKRIHTLMKNHNLSFKKHKISEENMKRLKTIEEKYGNFQNMIKNKIEWPSKEELEKMIMNNSIISIGKKLGVSDNSVRKTAKKFGIDIKSISKWSHKHGSNGHKNTDDKMVGKVGLEPT